MVSTLICEISSQGSTPDFPSLINALIAQMVEHLFYKQDVIGSNPIQCTYNAKVTQLVEWLPEEQKRNTETQEMIDKANAEFNQWAVKWCAAQ